MQSTTVPVPQITVEAFLGDRHAARYRDVVEGDPVAFDHVLAIVNDPLQQQQLVAAQRFGRPALAGIVEAIEADEFIAKALASSASLRFRQAVGVVVRLVMEALGWTTTEKKGPLRGAKSFTRAERYERPHREPHPVVTNQRARVALEAVARIGTEAERAETARELLDALGRTRRADHRPF